MCPQLQKKRSGARHFLTPQPSQRPNIHNHNRTRLGVWTQVYLPPEPALSITVLNHSHVLWVSSLTTLSCTLLLCGVSDANSFLVGSRASIRSYFFKGYLGSILSDFDAVWHVISTPLPATATHFHVQAQSSLVQTSSLGSNTTSKANVSAPSFVPSSLNYLWLVVGYKLQCKWTSLQIHESLQNCELKAGITSHSFLSLVMVQLAQNSQVQFWIE